MKKFILLFCILFLGSLVFAEPPVNKQVQNSSEIKTQEDNTTQQDENPDVDIQNEIEKYFPKKIKFQNPDLTTVEKENQNFYYDKQGKLIARDKRIDDKNFFYNQNGQFIGKSIKRNSNTYYYNGINKFLGYCTETECFDEDFKSLGTVPPLPTIKYFKPIIDNNILNPQEKIETKNEE